MLGCYHGVEWGRGLGKARLVNGEISEDGEHAVGA
ncbi:hypothetical protein BM1374166_01852 [Bartonella tribocorum]|nr:hypothetical protein BM1374166_01849 [Bartonella tribocorum]CDO49498.1 hypothetical protein BM1374166_01852 [Bartonella tribocorum]